MYIRVKKRDGGTEEFDADKIRGVVKTAGLSDADTEKLLTRLIKWLNELERPLVTTTQIRDRVIIEIQKMDSDAAETFISHEKLRDQEFN